MSSSFVQGTTLNATFYAEIVAPLVRPWPHAAALLGWGSDVLGYDTPRSTDHGWGPRLQVFVTGEHVRPASAAVDAGLPETFHGLPVRYGWDEHAERHHVEVTTTARWLRDQLGVDPRGRMSTTDWLVTPQQSLLGVVRGAVYADPDGELQDIRRLLAWYPDQVWQWLLASGWQRLAQEESFVGRTAEVGDELGSRLLAGRLARDVMRQVFLLRRTYAPYAKWFGTAFRALDGAGPFLDPLERAVAATDHPAREAALVEAYERLAQMHNEVLPSHHVEPTGRTFHTRPYRVLDASRFAAACLAGLQEPWLRDQPLTGSVDQFADSTDIVSAPATARRLGGLYNL